jgi:OFA family oxalate/formate antiporter-like MFS transporter
MAEETKAPLAQIENHGWRVTFAGLAINLALGILYTWSIIAGGIPEDWGWSQADKALPYSAACLVFCLIMIPAGRLQDKATPRLTATIGGILVGIGMILASRTSSVAGFVVGFGILAGAGIGFGYAACTPPAVKWFSAAKTGLIAGIVVSGFGLASVIWAPAARALIAANGLQSMMCILGIVFLIVVVGLAQILKPPPKGYVPLGAAPAKKPAVGDKKEDFLPREMLRTWQFYVIWFMYACGAGAGLMIISVAKKLGVQLEVGTTLVVFLAIGNGGGRILSGIISDKIGRTLTMFGFFVIQAIVIVMLALAGSEDSALATAPVMIALAAIAGANYGSNLTLFPSITKDFYGLKNFGANYGWVFTAWGVGGFMLALLAGKVYDKTHSFKFAFFCSAALLIIAAITSFIVKPPHHTIEHAHEHEHD